MKSPAARMQPLAPHFFAALSTRLAELQAAGRRVIRLDEGSPDLPPAPHIVEALARAAARPDAHGYQPHRGTPALRCAWAEMYDRVFSVRLDPETNVLPLLGSKEGIFNFLQAWIDPGDIVLIPDPGYITYTRGTLFAGGQPYYLPLLPETGYLPDLDAVPPEVARRSKVMWLNYPNNPTAATASRAFFESAVNFARRWDILILHDAAYTQVTFDDYQAPSLLEVQGAEEVAVEFNTLSKSHNMAGWRAAAALGNPAALRTLFTLKTNLDSGGFQPVLKAAAAAMTGDQAWLTERNEIYRQRRDAALRGLQAIGLNPQKPHASLYIWCPIPPGWTSAGFVEAVLEQAFVSLTPGTVFGPGGEGFLRISLTAPLEDIEQAMDRMKAVSASPLPQGEAG